MKARLIKFGEIEVEGKRYTHDVVIDGGKVRKRKKGPSKQFREKFGHTPLSAGEEIPWGGKRLIVGTGAHGALPVMDEVLAEAKRRGIEVIGGRGILPVDEGKQKMRQFGVWTSIYVRQRL